jgi:hypothetical protein
VTRPVAGTPRRHAAPARRAGMALAINTGGRWTPLLEEPAMNILTNITSATRAALLYITVGAVMTVWSAIYYTYLNNHPPAQGNDVPWYVCSGFLLTGIALFVIGCAVGWIGRAARQAEVPHEVINTRDSKGNPAANVVPLANNAVIPANSNQPPTLPINPAVQQPVAMPPTVPPTNPQP